MSNLRTCITETTGSEKEMKPVQEKSGIGFMAFELFEVRIVGVFCKLNKFGRKLQNKRLLEKI